MYHQITRYPLPQCMGSSANNRYRRICCGCLSHTMCTAIVVMCLALLRSMPHAVVHMEPFPEEAWDWGLHNSYLRTQPTLTEQHHRGVRLFEIDAYWWLGGNWVVAHTPAVGPGSHVNTLEEAVCMLRQLGGNITMLLDIKNVVWPSCGESAVQDLARTLGACAQDGPLRVLVDVYCGDYTNVQCARSLRGTPIVNTTLLCRGIDFWWMGVGGNDLLKRPCSEFTEPDLDTANFTKPVYMECIADRPTCERAAQVRAASWMQVTNY